MNSLIIHLSSTIARARNVETLMRTLPNGRVIEAVDANAIQYNQAADPHHEPIYPFEITKSELGCFLSHRKCWRIIAAGSSPFSLIAEDDMIIDAKLFDAAVDLLKRHANEDIFVRFPTKAREKAAKSIAVEGSAQLFLPQTIGLQSVCQIVGRNAAKRLLAASQITDRPVDTFLQMHWVTGQPVLSVYPNGVSELSCASTIQKKTRISASLMRDFKRARYRSRISQRPQIAYVPT